MARLAVLSTVYGWLVCWLASSTYGCKKRKSSGTKTTLLLYLLASWTATFPTQRRWIFSGLSASSALPYSVCSRPPAFAQLSEREFRELYERGNPGAPQPERPPETQCWIPQTDCVRIRPEWQGDAFHTVTINNCPRRVYVWMCHKITGTAWGIKRNDCGAFGVSAGHQYRYLTPPLLDPTGRWDAKWIGSDRQEEDWICRDLVPGWDENPF